MDKQADKQRAQDTLPSNPAPGQKWLHYKGGLYEIITLGVEEETATQVVVYRSLKYGKIWTRSVKNWFETVDLASGETVQRFVQVKQDG